MWTFQPRETPHDRTRRRLRERSKMLKAAQAEIENLKGRLETLRRDHEQAIAHYTEVERDRDARIEELETLVKLREMEMRGLSEVIERDRERVKAEAAVEVARAESAAMRARHEQQGGGHHAWLP